MGIGHRPGPAVQDNNNLDILLEPLSDDSHPTD